MERKPWRYPTWDQFLLSGILYSLALGLPYSLSPWLQDAIPPGSALFVLLLGPSAVFAFFWPLMKPQPAGLIGSALSFLVFVFAVLPLLMNLTEAMARSGAIEEETVKTRLKILSETRFVEVQRVTAHPAADGYIVVATQALDEAKSQELLARFRELPFERVTPAQCHVPGVALRLLNTEKQLVAEISLCWDCHNLRASPESREEFRGYEEDFQADSKRGQAFLEYLQGLVAKAKS